ncbi:MAG: cytochrome ubiquinol oxidase subunit I [Phycisphaerae bacterium]
MDVSTLVPLNPLAALDVTMLSRIQFALTISFHYIFPPLTIGLGIVLVYLGAQYLRTGEAIYHQAQKFWTKMFALNFALGVASGIVMEFQFGTNWAIYSRVVGDVFGSALAAEGIFAFFLESGFLAVLVFGWNKVGKKMHFFSTCMVALGSIFSAVWIVVANSWQQTPAGHTWVFENDIWKANIIDFWAVVFNPSSMIRLIHTLIGCFVVGSAFVLSISSWYLLKGRHMEFARRSFRGGLVMATLATLAQAGTGHYQAITVYENQPAKLAAFEGHFNSGPGAITLIGIPDQEAGVMHYSLEIPGLLGFLISGDFDMDVAGLDKFRLEDEPPVWPVFITWRLMVGIGTLLIVVNLIAVYYYFRGTLFEKRWLLWFYVFAIGLTFIANHAGWYSAEIGRQPFIVYPQAGTLADLPPDSAPGAVQEAVADENGLLGRPAVPDLVWSGQKKGEGELLTGPEGYVVFNEEQLLRTSRGITSETVVSAGQVLGSIVGFGAIYLLLGGVWIWILNNKIQLGPDMSPPHWDVPPGDGPPGEEPAEEEGFFEAATGRPDHRQSLTESDTRKSNDQ